MSRARASARRLAALALAGALSASAGCLGSTEPSGPVADVTGVWSYTSTTTAPTSASATGELVITTQRGGDVAGTLDVLETDAASRTVRLTGPVSGRVVDSTTIDVDALVGDAPRRHVGQLRNDTLRGSWAELTTGGTGASGTFVAVRQAEGAR